DDGGGALPAGMGGDDSRGAADADDEPEPQGGGHKPSGVHATRLGRTTTSGLRLPDGPDNLPGAFTIRPPDVNLPAGRWQSGRATPAPPCRTTPDGFRQRKDEADARSLST